MSYTKLSIGKECADQINEIKEALGMKNSSEVARMSIHAFRNRLIESGLITQAVAFENEEEVNAPSGNTTPFITSFYISQFINDFSQLSVVERPTLAWSGAGLVAERGDSTSFSSLDRGHVWA